MHLTPNMYKMATLKANAKEIVTFKCVIYIYIIIIIKYIKSAAVFHFPVHFPVPVYAIVLPICDMG